MVTKWGLSEELGPLLYGSEDQDPFGYGGGAAAKAMSEETQKRVDAEVRSIIDECYKRASQTLEDNRDILDSMCEALMKYETIGAEQIDQLMARTEVSPPEGWSDMPERDAEPAPQNQAPEPEAEKAQASDVESDMPNGDDAPGAAGDQSEGEEPKA
jgi:cell division protease FtsH